MVVMEGMEYLGRKGFRRRGHRRVVGGPYYVGPEYIVAEPSGHVTIYDGSGNIVAVVSGRIVSLAAGYTTAPIKMAVPQAALPGAVPASLVGLKGVF